MLEPDFFRIDLNRLDEEWEQQPEFFYKYASQLAEARYEQDRTKANLDIVKAEMDTKIRENPSKYKLTKVTEGTVSNAVTLSPEVAEALDEMLDARKRVDELYAITNALEHRKAALERLVSLHGQNYFASPREDRASRETRQEERKKQARKPLRNTRKK